MSTVLLEKITNDERIALLTVNRPEVLNALNDAVMAELEAAVDKLERDETVKALIITGAGERSFVAGRTSRNLPCAHRRSTTPSACRRTRCYPA